MAIAIKLVALLCHSLILIRSCERAVCTNLTAPIPVGGSRALAVHEFWVSPGRIFTFGFVEKVVAATVLNSSTARFSLSLFYTHLDTVVWTAHRGHLVSENASLELGDDGNLVLKDGAAEIWSTGSAGLGVVSANVSDQGRLVLVNSSMGIVWDSWLSPTDTLLPGQSLYSNMSLIGSEGRYFLIMQRDSNLVMYAPYRMAYWASNTYQRNFTRMFFDSTGSLTFIDDRSPEQPLGVPGISASLAEYSDRLKRLVMRNDGLLVYYALSDDFTSWDTIQYIPADACGVYEVCGPYALCASKNDPSNATHTCSCLDQSLVLIDAQNSASGCRIPGQPNVMDCDSDTRLIRFPGVKFPKYSFILDHVSVSYKPTTADDCAEQCSLNCSCAGVVYDQGLQQCTWLAVEEINSGNHNSISFISFIKVAAASQVNNASGITPDKPGASPSKSGGVSTRVALSVGFTSGMLISAGVLAVIVLCYIRRSRHIIRGPSYADEEDAQSLLASTGPLHFSYSQLQAATNGFSSVLGRGGFGRVYRGVLAGGMRVAVKVLEGSSTFGAKQFSAEVRTIGSIHHVNLVRLRGYCVSGERRLLVYDLMANGSLDRYLYAAATTTTASSASSSSSTTFAGPLSWEKRFQIVVGTARGIRYLHEECQPSIIHCDVKPQNILLDEDFRAKISDFGLAQLVGGEFTGTITRVRGTAGYMAPEWTSTNRINPKLDVYSFGMVTLEILSGRKIIDLSVSASQVELASWAYLQFTTHELEDLSSILDPRLLAVDATIPHSPEFTRCVMVAFWCIQRDPSLRPSMGVAVQMLEGLWAIEQPPYPF